MASGNQVICYNTIPNPIEASAPTGGSPPYNFQWQFSLDGFVFEDIPGATSFVFQPGPLFSTTHYRQLQSSSNGCNSPGLLTNTITVTVYPTMIAGTISDNQVITQYSTPNLLTGTEPVGGNPPYTYQWEMSTDSLTFYEIEGATGLHYQPGPLAVTTYFRLMQKSSCNMGLPSNVITITVTNMPQTLYLSNLTISANQSQCYNAFQTITLAGGLTALFHVQPGGIVNLIAGENIHMYSGTDVDSGGYLHAYITNTGNFCSNVKSTIPFTRVVMIEPEGWSLSAGSGQSFGCFPNPTPGRLYLLLSEEPACMPILIRIYNLLGVEVISTVIYDGILHELSLENVAKGIYLVSVTQNGRTEVQKVIKH